jgi:AcrR family transcriptional regulator
MTPRIRRDDQHQAVLDAIKQAARNLMAEKGTAGLSIRAIARRLEMTPPALYHYFANLDALITALIADAYHALADTLEAALADQCDLAPADQLRLLMRLYREWALAHPTDFTLIYGSPIPGYQAPVEATLPAARRTLTLFATISGSALQQGAAPVADVPAPLRDSLAAVRDHEGLDLPLGALYFTIVGWSQIHGLIMLELFNHLQPLIDDRAALYHHAVDRMLLSFGV